MRRELESSNGTVRYWAIFNDNGNRIGTDIETIPTTEMQQQDADRRLLTDYNALSAPSAAQTTAAVKALIRLQS